MNTLDFLYISLGVGFLTLVVFICYLLKKVVETIEIAQKVIENLENTTDGVLHFKDTLKTSALRLVGKFLKGGR